VTHRAAEHRRRVRQRQILHWAQGGKCAGCGLSVGFAGRGRRTLPSYPTFEKARGGHRVLVNGLLKHRSCNEARDDLPPTGCDRIWQGVVLARLTSNEASALWNIETRGSSFSMTLPATVFESPKQKS